MTLFPYTTLFRSPSQDDRAPLALAQGERGHVIKRNEKSERRKEKGGKRKEEREKEKEGYVEERE